MDIIVPVEIGKLKLIKENESDIAVVSEGIFYFQNNVAKLFVRTFEFTDEIDRVRAERARDRAEEMLAQQLDAHELQEAELALKRALTRLSVTK
jgi:F0F1-type ATP synthase, epsilon subunit (mitochondrial delta subunit)